MFADFRNSLTVLFSEKFATYETKNVKNRLRLVVADKYLEKHVLWTTVYTNGRVQTICLGRHDVSDALRDCGEGVEKKKRT